MTYLVNVLFSSAPAIPSETIALPLRRKAGPSDLKILTRIHWLHLRLTSRFGNAGYELASRVCPIFPDTAPDLERWLKLTAECTGVCPYVTVKREPAADFKEFIGVPEKFEKYFSPNPWQGN